MLSASCATDQPSMSADPCDSVTEEGEGGLIAFVPRGTSWGPPLRKSLNIFKRKREPSDRLPLQDCGVSSARELAGDRDLEDPPGRALVAASRRALGRLPRGRSLFAVPTSKGGLCVIVTEPGSSYSCGNGSNLPDISYANPTRGKPYLAAILPNEIVAITVRTARRRVRVPVHENAFYFQLADEVELESIGLIAEYQDGSEQRVGWNQ